MFTGGGDCPGLNAVIRAVVRAAARSCVNVIGVPTPWQSWSSDALNQRPSGHPVGCSGCLDEAVSLSR